MSKLLIKEFYIKYKLRWNKIKCPHCNAEIHQFNVQQVYDDYKIVGPTSGKIMEPYLRDAISRTAAILCPKCDKVLHFVSKWS